MLAARYWDVLLLKGFARLNAGVTLEQASAEAQVLHAQYLKSHPGFAYEDGSTMRLTPLRERLIADVRPMLWMLLGAVGLVLLIACANVASLGGSSELGMTRAHR